MHAASSYSLEDPPSQIRQAIDSQLASPVAPLAFLPIDARPDVNVPILVPSRFRVKCQNAPRDIVVLNSRGFAGSLLAKDETCRPRFVPPAWIASGCLRSRSPEQAEWAPEC